MVNCNNKICVINTYKVQLSFSWHCKVRQDPTDGSIYFFFVVVVVVVVCFRLQSFLSGKRKPYETENSGSISNVLQNKKNPTSYHLM